MDNPEEPNIVAPSAGVHVILPNYYAPAHMGLIDPNTSDGRVIFFLPWQGQTIAGTTGKYLFGYMDAFSVPCNSLLNCMPPVRLPD